MASRPLLGAIFGHFEPFWALTVGAKATSGSVHPKVDVKWGGESKLAGLEGASGVLTPFWGHFWSF